MRSIGEDDLLTIDAIGERLLDDERIEHQIEGLMGKSRLELMKMIETLSVKLQAYEGQMIGPREAAEMFNRKKSWIYDAIARPKTPVQMQLASAVKRDNRVILFRLSDVVRIRERMCAGIDA